MCRWCASGRRSRAGCEKLILWLPPLGGSRRAGGILPPEGGSHESVANGEGEMFKATGLWTGAAKRIAVVFAVCLLQAAVASAQLIISEFRVRGPGGANDEFVEIYNNSGGSHTVAGGGTGYALAASNGVARCVVPNGTIIPERGHYLCVNSVGYSLASYPAGNGTTATGDATYTTDIPDNAGHCALQHVGRRGLHARQPARRRGLHERGQHPVQGRRRLSGADTIQHRLRVHAQAAGRLYRIVGRGVQQRAVDPDHSGPALQPGPGHQQQRHRLHLRGHQRDQRRRGPAAGRARAGEHDLTDCLR